MTANVVECADVGVAEGGYRPRFPSEPRAHLRIECYAGRQNRHEAIQAGVCGAENLSHAAGAEAAFNPVQAQEVTGTKIETSTEQGRRGRPHGLIHDDARRILAKQRLHFAPQCLVARARVGKKRVARCRILVEGLVVDSRDVCQRSGVRSTSSRRRLRGQGIRGGRYTGIYSAAADRRRVPRTPGTGQEGTGNGVARVAAVADEEPDRA